MNTRRDFIKCMATAGVAVAFHLDAHAKKRSEDSVHYTKDVCDPTSSGKRFDLPCIERLIRAGLFVPDVISRSPKCTDSMDDSYFPRPSNQALEPGVSVAVAISASRAPGR